MSFKQFPSRLQAMLILVLASFLFSACGDLLQSANWPGLAARDAIVLVAFGPGVRAFDIESREHLWTYPSEPEGQRSFYAPPSVDGDRVIIGDYGTPGGFFSRGAKVAIEAFEFDDRDTLESVWREPVITTDRIVAEPLQVGNTVYVGTADNLVLALDAESGNEKWRFEAEHSVWAQPIFDSDVLYVVSLDKKLYALDAGSGDLKWELEFGGSIISRPAINGDRLFAGSFDNMLHAVDLVNGEETWVVEADGWVWAGPTVAEDRVFFADLSGNLYAVEAATGAEVWTVRDSEIGLVQAAPIVIDDLVIFAGGDPEDAEVRAGMLIAFDRDSGEEQWREDTRYPVLSDPLLVAGKLVVAMTSEAGQLYLYLFDPTDGQQDGPPIEPIEQVADQNG